MGSGDSGVVIHMPGHLGEERSLGGWPNLIEVANLAIGHFNEIADPNYNYMAMAYVGGSLGLRTRTSRHGSSQ